MSPPSHRIPPAALAAVAAMAVAGLVLGGQGRADTATQRAPTVSARSAATEPAEYDDSPAVAPGAGLLRRWDSRRAQAYARGDPVALRRLYVAGSSAGDADVAVLRGYLRRGLRVDDLRVQLLSVHEIARAPGHRRLRVTDRVQHVVAVRPDGSRLRLPRDRATTRVIVLRRTPTGWKVASVGPPASDEQPGHRCRPGSLSLPTLRRGGR